MYRFLGKHDVAAQAANRTLEAAPDFVPARARVLEAEIPQRHPPLRDHAFENILDPRLGQGSWQESWLLAYRSARDKR